MNEQNIIRERLTFTGRVQGVGFRYRAKHAGRQCGSYRMGNKRVGWQCCDGSAGDSGPD